MLVDISNSNIEKLTTLAEAQGTDIGTLLNNLIASDFENRPKHHMDLDGVTFTGNTGINLLLNVLNYYGLENVHNKLVECGLSEKAMAIVKTHDNGIPRHHTLVEENGKKYYVYRNLTVSQICDEIAKVQNILA